MPPAKSIAILQSNYIPWKGYFDIIASVDEFVIFDDVQFTRRDWRNRNKIVLDGRVQWLTIPVASKGRYDAPIQEIEVSEPDWATKHWRSIQHAYRKAPHYKEYAPFLEELYTRAGSLRRLTAINELFLRAFADRLGLTTQFVRSSEIPRVADNPTGRLVEICVGRAGREYVSGPAARSYIENAQFEAAGIALCYANYRGYPTYDQRLEPFEHGVSIIDLMMCCGPAARDHLKSLRDRDSFLDRP